YVSVEHLLMALLAEGPATAAGRLLQADGVTRDAFLQALTTIRGNQRVTSAMPESAYEALAKYGRDLVAEAASGKLDPVIGRDAEIRRVIQILSRRTCGTRRSSASTWAPWSPAPSTAASSRNGSRPSSPRSGPPPDASCCS